MKCIDPRGAPGGKGGLPVPSRRSRTKEWSAKPIRDRCSPFGQLYVQLWAVPACRRRELCTVHLPSCFAANAFVRCPVVPVATLHLAAVNQKCKPPPGGSTVASLELKGIDGTRHTAWRVRLNSMGREKRTRARLSFERSVRLSFGVLRGGAWSLSVREVKCPLNCTNGHDRRASSGCGLRSSRARKVPRIAGLSCSAKPPAARARHGPAELDGASRSGLSGLRVDPFPLWSLGIIA